VTVKFTINVCVFLSKLYDKTVYISTTPLAAQRRFVSCQLHTRVFGLERQLHLTKTMSKQALPAAPYMWWKALHYNCFNLKTRACKILCWTTERCWSWKTTPNLPSWNTSPIRLNSIEKRSASLCCSLGWSWAEVTRGQTKASGKLLVALWRAMGSTSRPLALALCSWTDTKDCLNRY